MNSIIQGSAADQTKLAILLLEHNPEWLKLGGKFILPVHDELIAEATGFAETDNEDILNARKTFRELEAKFKEETSKEAEKVREAGGLCIIGTERHESRRIDNQLVQKCL